MMIIAITLKEICDAAQQQQRTAYLPVCNEFQGLYLSFFINFLKLLVERTCVM
jgi:hypothetical protein